MSKTAFAIGEIAGAIALMVATYGTAAPIIGVWGISAGTATTLFSVGVMAGITGVFGLLQPLLNPQDTSVPGSQANAKDSAAFRRVIYGVMETGGVLTFDEMPSGSGEFQNPPDAAGNYVGMSNWRHQIYTVAAHQITGFGRGGISGAGPNVTNIPMVVIDDIATELVLDASGYYVPKDSLNPYGGIVENPAFHIAFEFDAGDPAADTAFPLLRAACPDWADSCVQRGRAKVHVAMRYDVNAAGSGANPNGNLWTQVPIYVSGRVPTFRFPLIGKTLGDTRGIASIYPTTNPEIGSGWEGVTPTGGVGVVENFPSGGGPLIDSAGTTSFSGFPPLPGGATSAVLSLNIGVSSDPYKVGLGTGEFSTQYSLDGGATFTSVPGAPTSGTKANAVYQIALSPTQDMSLVIIESSASWGGSLTEYGTAEIVISGIFSEAFTGGATANPWNPALCVYDWLTNTEYGEGADPATIDLDSVNAAANICEELVTVYIASNGFAVTEPRYSCNGVFDEGATRGDVLKSLLSSMAGVVIPPGDMWHVFAGAYNPPSFTLTDADLRGNIKGDFRISRRDIANGVKGTFIPSFLPTNQTELQPAAWRWTDYPPYQGNGLQGHPDYITEDGGDPIWKEMRLGFTTSIYMAQRLAKIGLMLLRFQVSLHLACKLTAFPIQAGDTITYIHERWAALDNPPPTTFFVTQATLIAENTGGGMAWGMDLTLRETDPSIYEFAAPTIYLAPGAEWVEGAGEYSQYETLGVY